MNTYFRYAVSLFLVHWIPLLSFLAGAAPAFDAMSFRQDALVLIEQEDYRAVKNLAEDCLRQDEQIAACHQVLGLAYLWEKETERAIQAFKTAESLDPEYRAKALTGILAAYIVSAQYEEAESLIDSALQEFPESASLHFTVAEYYNKIGKQAMAEAHRDIVASLNPTYNGQPVFVLAAVAFVAKVFLTALARALAVELIKELL